TTHGMRLRDEQGVLDARSGRDSNIFGRHHQVVRVNRVGDKQRREGNRVPPVGTDPETKSELFISTSHLSQHNPNKEVFLNPVKGYRAKLQVYHPKQYQTNKNKKQSYRGQRLHPYLSDSMVGKIG